MTIAADRRGFSLLEVLFATTILTIAVLSVAQLFAVAARANASARTSAVAALLASQKIEQLRALAWSFDASGVPFTDTTTGSVGLSPSPDGALDRDVDGYSDWLDASGRAVLRASAAAYVRRWSIAPLPSNPDTLVLQVKVVPIGAPVGGAHFVTVKTRKGA